MTLSATLNQAILTIRCPHCGHSFDKKGSWVKVVRQYACDRCHQRVIMGYDARLAIFHENEPAHTLRQSMRRQADTGFAKNAP
jgi:DNA-directed RNA polymerase subunit RPC12/RpoP